MRIKRRMLSMLLSVVMMLSLLPATALAATAGYGVFIGGVEFSSNNLEIACGTGTATFDPDTRTVTLDSAVIDVGNNKSGVLSTSGDNLIVVLKGNSSIKAHDYGIYSSGELVISGTGSIEIESWFVSIGAEKNVNIENSGDIKITNNASAGIYSNTGSISISGTGDMDVSTLHNNGIVADKDISILGKNALNVEACNSGIVSNTGSITISNNGEVAIIAKGEENNGYGIEAPSGGVTLSGNEEVTITAKKVGISASSSIAISGGADITSSSQSAIEARNEIVLGEGYLLTEPTNAEIATISMGQQSTMVTVMDKDASAPAKHVVIVECEHLNTEIVDKIDATCTVDGYTGDTLCKDCEVTVVEGDVIKAAHKEVVDKAVDATCDKAGKTEGKHCSVCAEVLVAQKEVPAKGHADLNLDGKCDECAGDMTVTYTMKSGDNSEWTKGSKDGLLFVSTAEFSVFKAVKVDGVEIAATNYTAKSGSTEVLLKTTYLETLAVGAHTLAIVSSNGVATAKFVVKEKPADKTPETGDSMNVLAILGIAMLSALVIGYVSFKKREIQ